MDMSTPARSLLVALMLTGCAAAPLAPSPPAPGQQTFTGEVWTWDEQASTVTLRQGERILRVKVAPEALGGLQLHRVVTVLGEVAPAAIEQVLLPAGHLVPRGAADQAELRGAVAAIDPAGAVTVSAPPGALRVWLAEPGSRPYQNGQEVLVRMRVQALEVVPAREGQPGPSPPSPAEGPEPGDYAVVQGRVTEVDAVGRLTVESPRGPVTVWLPGGSRYRVGGWVEVRTSVHPGS
jgi:hypothetical protein